jgi:NAD(P)-dependent dehydrogenase (short-subunit alcohol dehydrogenase family)
MSNKKVWLVTSAGRGLDLDIAKAALAAGFDVVATSRNPEKVAKAIGESDNLLVVKLDITNPADAEAAVKQAVDRFGRIDVLVNNAASFYAGFFEELSMEEIELQVSTSLFGPMNVTRAVLPLMRKQRSGQIITISSTAGLVGFPFCSAYAASKFGTDGWMESLQGEVAPFGVQTIIVNPGFFAQNCFPKSRQNMPKRSSTIIARPGRSKCNSGRVQTVSNPATRPNLLRR